MITKIFSKLSRMFGRPGLSVVGETPKTPSPKFSLPKLGAKRCNWQPQGKKNASFSAWRCSACGVQAYSRTGAAPDQCKKGLDGRL
ncbi:MAG: hypothetical protein JXR13_12055 [Thalassovita sp.]